MRNGVAIADLFRICYIHKFGGYWFDIDIEPTKLILPTSGHIHLFDVGYENISYMLIGGAPNQTLFSTVIETVIRNINNNIPRKTQHIMDITGPRIIQNIICEKLKIKNEDGCMKGTLESQLYLPQSTFQFIYTKINILNTKTEIYKRLQQKYNKKQYQTYNYI